MLGAEVNQAMCDAGVHTLVMNGYGGKCIMVNKDVRHLEASAKPDGTPPDMHSKADIAIFEVLQQIWAARYNTGLLIKLMPKGIAFSFFLFYCNRSRTALALPCLCGQSAIHLV